MGYSIIFETKIVKLNDGRLLHLDRSGCNNDDAGRVQTEFSGDIYTVSEFLNRANSFINRDKVDGWELKIGSKYATYCDYGKHLIRMYNRSQKYDDFINERYFYGIRYDGVELFEPEHKILSGEEFDKIFYDMLYDGKKFSYMRLTTDLNNEDDIIKALDNKETVEFYVGKKYKTRVT